MPEASHLQIRHRPLGLEFSKGVGRIGVVRIREILHVEHRHDDLGGRADVQIGQAGACRPGVHGDLQALFHVSGGNNTRERVRVRVLHHPQAIRDGGGKRGRTGESQDEVRLPTQSERGGNRRRCRCSGSGHMHLDQGFPIPHQSEIRIRCFEHMGLPEINRIDSLRLRDECSERQS